MKCAVCDGVLKRKRHSEELSAHQVMVDGSLQLVHAWCAPDAQPKRLPYYAAMRQPTQANDPNRFA